MTLPVSGRDEPMREPDYSRLVEVGCRGVDVLETVTQALGKVSDRDLMADRDDGDGLESAKRLSGSGTP